MIADAVYLAIAGIGFCHAAGRSIISRGLRAGMNDLMRQNRANGEDDLEDGILRLDQEILKEAESFRFDHILLKCHAQRLRSGFSHPLRREVLEPPSVGAALQRFVHSY